MTNTAPARKTTKVGTVIGQEDGQDRHRPGGAAGPPPALQEDRPPAADVPGPRRTEKPARSATWSASSRPGPISKLKRWRVVEVVGLERPAASDPAIGEGSHDPAVHPSQGRGQLRGPQDPLHHAAGRRDGAGLLDRRRHLGLRPRGRARQQGRQGQGRPGRRRPGPQGDPPPGRILHPLRRQRRRHHRQGQRAGRDPRLRTGRPRAAGEEVHEDRLPRPGGAVMAAGIRKNDIVIVRQGKDKGKTGKVLAGQPGQGPGPRRAARTSSRSSSGPTGPRTSRAGSWSEEAPIPLSRLMLYCGECASRRPAPAQAARGRHPDPGLPQVRRRPGQGQVRSSDEPPARTATKKRSCPSCEKELGIANPMAVPRLEKIVINVGVGEAIQNAKLLDAAKAELTQITGQAPVDQPGQEVHFRLQAAQGRGHRLLRHPPPAADVRVPGPAGQHRPAPRPRLPRRLAQGLRRPRQLHPGPARPAGLPRDRLHQGREAPGHEHHHRHHGADRRRKPSPCSRSWACRSASRDEGEVTMSTTSAFAKYLRKPKYAIRTRGAAGSAAAPAATTGSSTCAGSASASWPTRARSRASSRRPGKGRKGCTMSVTIPSRTC